MNNLFPKGFDKLKHVMALASLVALAVVATCFQLYATDANLSVGYQPEQPIPFSHKLHAGDHKIDCRYCHVNVEKGPASTIPASSVCMNCHSKIKTDSPKLKALFEHHKAGTPIPWVRIHKLPDYAYFNHSVHLAKGVSCVSCHGKVNEMTVVSQRKPLSMRWCIECHENPYPHIRPDDVKKTDMDWEWKDKATQDAFIAKLKDEKKINPPKDCGACHN